eukprot:Pgem_evm1s6472
MMNTAMPISALILGSTAAAATPVFDSPVQAPASFDCTNFYNSHPGQVFQVGVNNILAWGFKMNYTVTYLNSLNSKTNYYHSDGLDNYYINEAPVLYDNNGCKKVVDRIDFDVSFVDRVTKKEFVHLSFAYFGKLFPTDQVEESWKFALYSDDKGLVHYNSGNSWFNMSME